jgi:hypothetical protein
MKLQQIFFAALLALEAYLAYDLIQHPYIVDNVVDQKVTAFSWLIIISLLMLSVWGLTHKWRKN